MFTLIQDLRYAVRTMIKRPGFTLIAVITLALGIGGSTAIFTVVDAAILRGLPYKSPENLYHLWETTPQQQFGQREFSYPDFEDYQQNQVCEGLAAYTGGGAILNGRGDPERVAAPAATANFFSVLGIDPFIGRTFQPGEDKPGTPRVVVLSYGLWQRKFAGDRNVVGQPINLSGQISTIVGVLPPTFQFALRPADLWQIYQPTDAQRTRRYMHGTNLIARLKPGVSAAQAHSELSVITQRIEQQFKESHAGTTLKLVPLQEQVVGQVKPILMLLLAAVGLVLVIACANVAGLLLTRSLSRQKEVVIRAALGASRWRVVRQLLTESMLLSLIGGVVGLLLARWGVSGIVAILPDNQISALPFLMHLGVNPKMLAFSFGIALLTGLLSGLIPALQASRPQLNQVLKEGGRSTAAVTGHRLRSAFVITEIALAVVLLIGAGLLLKSLMHVLKTSPGFNPDNLLTMTVVLPADKFQDPARQVSFFDQLDQRLRQTPGVNAVGSIDILPLQPGNTTRFYVEGDPVPAPGQEVEANARVVDDDYFQTLGVPLLAGRTFSTADEPNGPTTVIIGKTIADKMFAGRDPIGRHLLYTGVKAPPMVIVGVVGDVKITGLDQALRPVLYYSFRQNPTVAMNLVVRTSSDPNALAATVREQTRSLEPEVAIFNVRAMDDVIATSPAAFLRKFPATLITIFAVLSLLLSSIGIYGVISFAVSQQTHHIGVRMALGAQAFDILKMVLRQGFVLALMGIAIGIVAALSVTRLLNSLLFEVPANDLTIFLIVVGTLSLVALLACYFPARRATKVDPLIALRYE